MNSKLILLLGGILASLVVFLCIKNETKEIQNSKIQTQPVKQTEKKNITLKEATFDYSYNNHSINGSFSITEQSYMDNMINNYCKDINCSKNIIYKGHIKKSNWRKLSVDAMQFFQKHNVEGSKILASGDNITIEGNLNSEEQFHEINSILNEYNSSRLTISNKIKFIPTKLPPKASIQNIQEDINKMLEENPIYFEFGSDILTSDSKKTLLNIIKSLNKLGTESSLNIDGHTDARGKKSYNLLLSKKRAKKVKSFLEDNNLEDLLLVKSRGFGSSKPKMKNNKDPKNRRVEITIKKDTND